MKTKLHFRSIFNCLSLAVISLVAGISVKAQTYTTVANGLWNLSSTWQGGIIPPAGDISSTAVINIKHVVVYVGGSFSNEGTISITNPQGVSPRLIVPGGVDVTNKTNGKINIINAEYRQYRFIGGLEIGLPQSGKVKNDGGYIQISNSFVEVAQHWSNEGNGIVVFRNSSLEIGGDYDLKNSAKDTIENTSISVGMHGSGDYIADGYSTYFQAARIQVASTDGKFDLKSGKANGSIDYIMLKNHVTNIYSNDKIEASSSLVITGGLILKAYCIADASKYKSNGKFSGTRTQDCSLNYFPAGLMVSTSTASFNFSTTPSLISGIALTVGSVYKYEGVTPGVDAIVKVDSLVGGATITRIDDNTGGLGFIEGFQPEIKAGPAAGESYAVFTINYRITGTSENHTMNTFSITALDIDGNSTLKEFDQIDMGPGAVAAYKSSPTNILLTQAGPGAYRGINADGNTINGIDTMSMANMFTVSNTTVSSFTLTLGVVKTDAVQSVRQFGIYMKGFVYPSLTSLPVKLESFIATLKSSSNKVDLKWTTASEKDVSHFVIEKSIDGTNYSDAGLVFANGNTSDKMNYGFTDGNINTSQAGVIYYRLRSVDIDGKSQFSEIRIIRISKETGAIKMITYPNPVSSELRVTIPSSWQGKEVLFEVFNQNGQKVKISKSGNTSQTENIMVSDLSKGFYLIKATCGSETAQQKIIKN